MVKVIEIINHPLYFITLFFLITMHSSDQILQDHFSQTIQFYCDIYINTPPPHYRDFIAYYLNNPLHRLQQVVAFKSLTSVPYPQIITKRHDRNDIFFIIYTVYENSEDIAMSTNVDYLYSNAGQKGLNKQEERGYKVYATWECALILHVQVHFAID